MKTYSLTVITPDGLMFDGEAESVLARTTMGDVCILASHTDYLTTIDAGRVKIKNGGAEKLAACSGGFMRVSDGKVRIVATTFEFADEIDVTRAQHARDAAKKRIAAAQSDKEMRLAEMKLKRALVRIDVTK